MTDQEAREMALVNKELIAVAQHVIGRIETTAACRHTGPSFRERQKVLCVLDAWLDTLDYGLDER